MRSAALKFDDEQPLPPAPLTTGGDGGGDEEGEEEGLWWEGHVVLAGPRFPLIRRFLPPRKRRRTKSTAVQLKFEF